MKKNANKKSMNVEMNESQKFIQQKRNEVKEIKKRVNCSAIINTSEAIGASIICGLCVGTVANTFKDENSSTALKVATTGIAAISVGLLSHRVIDAANSLKYIVIANKMSKATNAMLNLYEDVNEHSIKDAINEGLSQDADYDVEDIKEFMKKIDEELEEEEVIMTYNPEPESSDSGK